jgi:hypothetical protein
MEKPALMEAMVTSELFRPVMNLTNTNAPAVGDILALTMLSLFAVLCVDVRRVGFDKAIS